MAGGTGFDRSKFLSMREVLRALGPGWDESKVRRRIADRRLPGQKIRGRNWYFPKDAAMAAIAKLRENEDSVQLEPGERDAIAVAMLREGRSEGEVVVETRLPLDHVTRLRRSLGLDPPSSPAMPAAAPSVKKIRAAAARAVLEDERPDSYMDDWIKASRARMKEHR